MLTTKLRSLSVEASLKRAILGGLVLCQFACGGGSSTQDTAAQGAEVQGVSADSIDRFLTTADVEQIIAQAVHQATALGVNATIAVSDRVGNVLGVYRMAEQRVILATQLAADGSAVISGGLEGIALPTTAVPLSLDGQAAIAKAVTGAYLSTEGNAFTSRTASQIVQDHFNPGERNQPGGPLFGVQFSQLACSDFVSKFETGATAADVGPKRSPLGLSADPGGLPLYKNGVMVGGVGVIADGLYGVDANLNDVDNDTDEAIAVAATYSYSAPVDIRGDRITVDGKTLRFTDIDFGDLVADPAVAPAYSSLTAANGSLAAVVGYSDGVIVRGTEFGAAESGIRPDTLDYPGLDAFVFVDNSDNVRFRPRAATDSATLGTNALTANEVQVLMASALGVANDARAQIRRPLNSQARVTISIVDTAGEVLAMARTRDAPIFGADVSLQKARTAAFFSTATAGAFIEALPDTKYLEINDTGTAFPLQIEMADYTLATKVFLQDVSALDNGTFAFSDRAGGNLSRPFYPDGIEGNPNGPLSKPVGEWSVLSTGFQLDLVNNGILQHVLFTVGAGVADVDVGCAGISLADDLSAISNTIPASRRVANGIQIFPGSVPIYRGDTLVGGIGVSGDGVDQDDLISFYGLYLAGEALNESNPTGNNIHNAPIAQRADNLTPQGIRLRFVQCPQSPFINSDEQNVCENK